jgi:hypothetical protein
MKQREKTGYGPILHRLLARGKKKTGWNYIRERETERETKTETSRGQL